jgi:hypothetical protein
MLKWDNFLQILKYAILFVLLLPKPFGSLKKIFLKEVKLLHLKLADLSVQMKHHGPCEGQGMGAKQDYRQEQGLGQEQGPGQYRKSEFSHFIQNHIVMRRI